MVAPHMSFPSVGTTSACGKSGWGCGSHWECQKVSVFGSVSVPSSRASFVPFGRVSLVNCSESAQILDGWNGVPIFAAGSSGAGTSPLSALFGAVQYSRAFVRHRVVVSRWHYVRLSLG